MKMLGHDYMRHHNENLKYLHLLLCKKYNIKILGKRLRIYSVKQIVAKKFIEIRIDTTIKIDIKNKYNKPDNVVIDDKSEEILIVKYKSHLLTTYNK